MNPVDCTAQPLDHERQEALLLTTRMICANGLEAVRCGESRRRTSDLLLGVLLGMALSLQIAAAAQLVE